MKAAIIGYGKMGREIERILLDRGHTVGLVIDRDNAAELDREHLAGIDAALEFSTPATAYDNIKTCIAARTPVVSGTTGWTERLEELQRMCRQSGGALFYASNFSLGVNIMFRLNRKLAELMRGHGEYDVKIEETHHIEKKDAPSGTAITLAEDIIARSDVKRGWINSPTGDRSLLEITSYREGKVPGIHTVTYSSQDDVLQLRHSITDRRTLALGAVIAAEYVCGRTGVYTMDDLLK